MEAERELEQAAKRFGLATDVSPAVALIEEVRRTAGIVAYLESKVSSLSEQELVYGISRVETTSGGQDGESKTKRVLEARPSIWYEMLLRERRHLVEASSAAVRAGVEQRQIELAERDALLVSDVVRRILDAFCGSLVNRGFDVTHLWDDLVAEIVPREFRALARGGE